MTTRVSGFKHWFTLVTLFDLASRPRPIWRYSTVPSWSGLLPTLPCTSKDRLPSASPDCYDSPARWVSHPPPQTCRLVAQA